MAAMWDQQVREWPRLAEGLASLRAAERRSFELGGSQILVQCNPARAVSASAKVDAASLAARPCFLCGSNLPREQCAVVYRQDWLILCNPAPILEPHYTVASVRHEPQRLERALPAMLSLARDLEGRYTVFYNGPRAGASAPDHLHLQASKAGALPFEKELIRQLCGGNGDWIDWVCSNGVRVGTTRNGRRAAVIVISGSIESTMSGVGRVLEVLGSIRPADPEPMVNLFATYADESWVTWLFPRAAHRPSVYGLTPDAFLISPGAIDLAGELIVPRREDLQRLDEARIRAVYDEVLLPAEQMQALRSRLG